MKTMIAIPCMDTVPVGFASSLLQLDKPPDTSVCFMPGSLIYDARNLLCLQAFENGFDRVMWLDSDMAFRPDLLTTLMTDMDTTGADLMTGIYFRRHLPTKPVLFKHIEEPRTDSTGKMVKAVEDYMDYPRDSIFPVDGCGFGAVLTKTELLHKVWDKFGPAFAPYVWAGEDISFCYRAKLIGARMLCDSNPTLGHIGMIQYTEKMYERM